MTLYTLIVVPIFKKKAEDKSESTGKEEMAGQKAEEKRANIIDSTFAS